MTEIHTGRSTPLVRLQGACVTRGGARLLESLDFCLEPGARLAVLGENGAGKTTFLRLVRGDIPPDEGGLRVYDLPGQGGPQPTPLGLRQRLALVSGDMQDLYARHEWAITGLEAVLTGYFDTPLLYAEPGQTMRRKARALLEALGLAHLAGRRMARLSSGQARAVLLARALVGGPDALLLDECLEGLDAPARREFLAALDRVALERPGLALLFSSHRTDELPACLTRAVTLAAGRLGKAVPLADALAGLEAARSDARPAPPQPDAAALAGALLLPPPVTGGFLARVSNADVVLGGAAILHQVSWVIRPGEHWAVLGENGAGKSTLLGLLAGDFWPSALDGEPGRVEYGFAAPGEVPDETRRRVGRVSAALDRDYGEDLRVDEAVCSGAAGSIGLYAEPGPEVRARAARLMEYFGIAALAGRRIRSLSRGQLRRVMLARALAGEPALLLLDEPMAGLDARARRAARGLFGRLAEAGVPLVIVTHHLRDLPEQVDRVLALKAGRVAFCGMRAEYERAQAARQGQPGPENN